MSYPPTRMDAPIARVTKSDRPQAQTVHSTDQGARLITTAIVATAPLPILSGVSALLPPTASRAAPTRPRIHCLSRRLSYRSPAHLYPSPAVPMLSCCGRPPRDGADQPSSQPLRCGPTWALRPTPTSCSRRRPGQAPAASCTQLPNRCGPPRHGAQTSPAPSRSTAAALPGR